MWAGRGWGMSVKCRGWGVRAHGLGVVHGAGWLHTLPQGLAPTALSFGDRYKMTCEYTWPNHLLGSDKAAVGALLEQHGLQGDVAFGHSKLFIRSPQTLVTLEQGRARLIPIIVLLLQKVRPRRDTHHGAGRGWVCTPGEGRGEWGCTTWSGGMCVHQQGPQAHFQVPQESPLARNRPRLKLT